MLGKLLDGRYKVVQVLSAGGFGETFIAEDTRRPGNPSCVLKRLKPAKSDEFYLQTARRLFNSEAEILEQLGNHQQIPRLLAYFEENEEFYLVQELIVGHTLSTEMLVNEPWEESQIIQMLIDVASVLEFVHGYEVIHRDIKPDNLIRRASDNKLVLIDFGAVKQMRTEMATSLTVKTVAIGTPGYMSAEQSQGKPRLNSDIYALGMIGIQASTGLLPNQFPEDPQTGEIIWQDKAQISAALAAILQKMVRYHFSDRYSRVSAVLQDLQKLQSSFQPTQAQKLSDYDNTDEQMLSTTASGITSPALLHKTLSVVRYIPLVGAGGLFLFKTATWIILLGVSLAAFGSGLFFLRSLYPKLARDYDAVFGIILFLSGILLLFQEFKSYRSQEVPIAQFMLTAACFYSIAESVHLRVEKQVRS
ncbi:serine/threonine protein kinase [Rivularia sp. PCC 7116]|uniref:protein kinase domain-containing protein n=1 Tax=Rivularia sp. PCC 7116 TaxID=373994 RepID=UPI00029ED2F0|nr:Ycf66 family protein [Rivularia sp. PCC 7116]AFY53099.1 serine/threonine protein kinase [Rivularia sp. PCC 7116]